MPTDLPGELESFSEGWIDASRPLHSATPVWPGDHPFKLDQTRESSFVLSSFSTTCHVGTHVDAPLHLDTTAHGVEAVRLAKQVVAAHGREAEYELRIAACGKMPQGDAPKSLYTATVDELTAYIAAAAPLAERTE